MRYEEMPSVRGLLRRAPFENLFALGNLRAVERGASDVTVWWSGAGRLGHGAVIFRLGGTCSLSVPLDGDEMGCAALVTAMWAQRAERALVQLTGIDDAVTAVLACTRGIPLSEERVLAYARLEAQPTIHDQPRLARLVRTMRAHDMGLVEACYAGSEWADHGPSRRAAQHYGLVFALVLDGEAVSAAMVDPLIDGLGMIRGVYTPPRFQRHGYATALVAGIARHLSAMEVTPCLMFDNPAAGRIYHRLGYREFARWRAVRFSA
jgi:predicted GNAT family acetyltransferase